MDIHKPKAAHSWREFLIEIGTIICGILIALGLEQVVERLHWQHQVELTEEALTKDVQNNLLGQYDRITIRPCLASRIAVLRDGLLKPDGKWHAMPWVDIPSGPAASQTTLAGAANPVPIEGRAIPDVYGAPEFGGGNGAWSAAVASGVPLHMKPERAAAFGALYRGFESRVQMEAVEQQLGTRLAPLAYDQTLSPAEQRQYLSVLGELDQIASVRAMYAAQALLYADRAGLRVKASRREGLLKQQRELFGGLFKTCLNPVAIPLAPG